jgi:hypothetical protein
MRITALLADAARVAEGKLYALGIGWDRIIPGFPFVVCGTVAVPWNLGTEKHTLRFDLIDGDGQPFTLPDSDEPFVIVQEAGPLRDHLLSDVKPGTTLNWHFIVDIGAGLPLRPETIYQFRLSLDGHHEEEWTLPFTTVASPAAPFQEAA